MWISGIGASLIFRRDSEAGSVVYHWFVHHVDTFPYGDNVWMVKNRSSQKRREAQTQQGRKRIRKPLCTVKRKRGNHWGWGRKKRLERMKQNLPEELLESERRVRKMNWYVSRDRAGERDRRLNSVQTGCVNKEFQGVASLHFKHGKPQSQIHISYSLHQSQTLIHQRIKPSKKKRRQSGYKEDIRSVIITADCVPQTRARSNATRLFEIAI